MRNFCLGALALAAISIGAPAPVTAGEFASEYTFVAFGFRVASTRFDARIDDRNYQIDGTLRSRGIARLFTTTSGSLAANGTLGDGAPARSDLDVRYLDDGTAKRTTIAVRDGRVTEVTTDPEVTITDDWLHTPAAELRGVFDPVAAMLVPARSFGEVCQRTLRMFDGAMRFNLPMEFVRIIPFSTQGYSGDAVTCRARFQPLSGYPAGKEDVAWARDTIHMEISFAPMGATGLYAPVRALIDIGMTEIRVTARRFEQVGG